MSDLISRKALLEKKIRIPIARIVTEDKIIYRDVVFVEDIEALPSAQLYTEEEIQTMQDLEWSQMEKMYELGKSERKKGKWNGYKSDNSEWQRDDGSPIFLICSECKEIVLNNGSAHWNFCPNCGADMREGEKE